MKIWRKEPERQKIRENYGNGLYIGDKGKINITEFLSDWENDNALTEIRRSVFKVWWWPLVDEYSFT